jgi:hypothetical protein
VDRVAQMDQNERSCSHRTLTIYLDRESENMQAFVKMFPSLRPPGTATDRICLSVIRAS